MISQRVEDIQYIPHSQVEVGSDDSWNSAPGIAMEARPPPSLFPPPRIKKLS